MGVFKIKSSIEHSSLIQVIKEEGHGYYVKMIHERPDYTEEKEEFIPKDLFDTCLRTGYFIAQ